MGYLQPLVFVPGLMGSMSNEIVPGTGSWGFGPASLIYDKYINKLEDMGYKKGETLFVCYYNWKKSCVSNAEEYLYKTIERVKQITQTKKMDIVAHSLGGLVVRSYICSEMYGDDIDKFIMLGCPNAGATDAYFLWSEGELPNRTNAEPHLINIIIEGYFHILKKYHNIESTKELIHKEFISIKELLPSHRFGNYLFYLDNQDIMRYISYDHLQYKNDFLDELNSNYKIYGKKGIIIYLIAGTGKATNKSIQVGQATFDKMSDLVHTEDISNEIKTYEGDGTVLVKSALDMVGIKYIIRSKHSDILLESEKLIRQVLVSDYRKMKNQYQTEKDFISIIVFGKGKFRLTIDKKDYIVQRNTHMKDLYYHENVNIRWLVIEKEKNKRIAINYDSYNNEKIDVLIRCNKEKRKEKIMIHKLRSYNLVDQ